MNVPTLERADDRSPRREARAGRRPGGRRGLLGAASGGLTALLFAGGLGWLLLLAIARWGTWQRPWPIEVLDTFALYAFVPLAGLLPAAILLRSRRLLALAVAAILFFVQQFGHAFLPPRAAAPTDGAVLRVLTYNVYGANRDAGPLAELIRSVDPDVVVLQELREGYAADLIRRVGKDYPFRITAALTTPNDGSGTFSRVPIADASAFQLGDNGNAFQHVRLRLDEREISLVNVHLASPEVPTSAWQRRLPRLRGFPTERRDRELGWLISQADRLSVPFVLAGDFNMSAGSRPYRQLPADWHDAFEEQGWGFGHTFPSSRTPWRMRFPLRFPLIRIDYILSSPELVPTRAWVSELDGSDHLPVVAELRLARS